MQFISLTSSTFWQIVLILLRANSEIQFPAWMLSLAGFPELSLSFQYPIFFFKDLGRVKSGVCMSWPNHTILENSFSIEFLLIVNSLNYKVFPSTISKVEKETKKGYAPFCTAIMF